MSNPFDCFGDDDLNDAGPAASLKDQLGRQRDAQGFITPAGQLITEPCVKCRGTGQWRPGYPCFTCKGQGKRTFRTNAATRAKGRARTAAKAANKAVEQANWREEHKAELDWLRRTADYQNRRTDGRVWGFPAELLDKVNQYGTLTDGQLQAVRGFIAKDEARRAERAAQAQQTKAAAPTVDVSKLEAAFNKARAYAKADNGDNVRWLKLRLDTFTFSDAPAKGQWAAAILVKEGDRKLGRIQDGKYFAYGVDEATKARVAAAAADPAGAAKAYGQRWKNCSICGRELTVEESRDRGIGPICAERFGF